MKEQSECVYRGFHMTGGGSEGMSSRKPWVGFSCQEHVCPVVWRGRREESPETPAEGGCGGRGGADDKAR